MSAVVPKNSWRKRYEKIKVVIAEAKDEFRNDLHQKALRRSERDNKKMLPVKKKKSIRNDIS